MKQVERIQLTLQTIRLQLAILEGEISELQVQQNPSKLELELSLGKQLQAQDLTTSRSEGVPEIMGGTETTDFPDCCAVGDDYHFKCSGTLIAPKLVVTADHCTHVTRVFLGGSDIDKLQSGEMIKVAREISNPDLDLKLLILEHESRIQPRRIAQEADVKNVRIATLAGFGTIDENGEIGYGIKRRVDVPIISLNCGASSDSKKYGCIKDHEIVAGHRGLRQDTCCGDSGGPLYIQNHNGDYLLLGATSRGAHSGFTICGDGGIYVRVDHSIEWIRQETGIVI